VSSYYARAASDPEQVRLIIGALGGAFPFEDVYSREHILATLN
jgi:hypothetical protein